MLTLIVQVYIVSGGYKLASTETLEKEGGTQWQEVASLPSVRQEVRGLGLNNGRFMISGQ